MKRIVSRGTLSWMGLWTSLLVLVSVPVALAGAVFALGSLVQISDPDPPDPLASCNADNIDAQQAMGSALFNSSEVEPWVDVNPTDANNIVATWQQDRWSDGGARGLFVAASTDGGATWTRVPLANTPHTTLCTGGTAANGGGFQRASDPWLSFGPDGTVYHISLSFNNFPPATRSGGFGPSALLVTKSTDKGMTWSAPVTIISDTNPRALNDKESITADPTNSKLVYAVWDRLQLPLGVVINPENVFGNGFKGPAMISRSTDGGVTFEAPRILFDPAANGQTIGNQIVVLPDGTLVNVTNWIVKVGNPHLGTSLFLLAVLRSTDKGVHWPSKPVVVSQIVDVPVTDPNTGEPVRTGDIIPEIAVDPRQGTSNLYVVWQDARFSGLKHADIAFSMSTDGGSTWTAPAMINKTPASANVPAFTPSVHVAPDGRVSVTYYDFRGLSSTNATTLPTDYWILNCLPSASDCTKAANWTEQHLAGPFDMKLAPIARGFFVGDYEGLGAAATTAGTVFDPVFVTTVSHADPTDVFAMTATAPTAMARRLLPANPGSLLARMVRALGLLSP
jgi:hypothetical protein